MNLITVTLPIIFRINCNLFLGEVIFDKKTLRYLKTYLPGYVDGVESNANTPNIMIGKCSPL